MRPAWTVFRSRDEFGGDGPLLSLSTAYGVCERTEGEGRAASEDTSGYRIVAPGDLVINRLIARYGAIAVSKLEGKISPAYWVLCTPHSYDSRYFGYLLNSSRYLSEIGARSKFMPPSQFDLPWDQFRSMPIACPSTDTQRSIADYLDAETARVDALITKKQRLSKLLNDRSARLSKQLVSERGEAKRIPLSSIFRISKGIEAQRLSAEYCSAHPGPFPVYSGQTIGLFGAIDSFDFSVPHGAIVVSTVGARVMSQTVVRGNFSLSQNCLLLIPHDPESIVVEYFVPQLQHLFEILRADIPDHMQPSLRVEDLRGQRLDVPSLEVQISVAAGLERIESSLSRITELLGQQVELLREQRQALISAAVTGEFEIPGVAA